MAVVFMEGFDTKSALGWSAEPTSYTAGRVTGESAQVTNSLVRSIPGNLTTASAGFAMYLESVAGPAFDTFSFYCTVNGNPYLAIESDHADIKVRHYKGTPGISSYPVTGVTMSVGTWSFWEATLVLAASGSIVLKKDGNVVYTYTGDTRNSNRPTDVITDVILAASTNPSYRVRYDDVYITDTSTALGDCVVHTMVPTSDSTPSAWTPSTGTSHYAVVDEIPPTYTDYLSTTAGDNLDDTYKVTVPGTLTSNSLAVEVRAHALKTDAGAANISLLADGQASSSIGVPTVSGLISAVFPTAAAGAAWTPAKLTSASFGVRDST